MTIVCQACDAIYIEITHVGAADNCGCIQYMILLHVLLVLLKYASWWFLKVARFLFYWLTNTS